MHQAAWGGNGTESPAAELNIPATGSQPRFYGLDGVRATAMLLGVFYHLPISFMNGGFGMGFGGGFVESPKAPIDEWLHSFRMPLFFLISGFFANMMLGKYGLKRYLSRRWWRIGAPLVIALFAFAGYRIATEPSQTTPGPGFGTGPFGVMGPGPGAGPFGAPGMAFPVGNGAFGPGPTPGGFAPGGFGPPGMAPAGPRTGPPAFPLPAEMTIPARDWADSLFHERSRHFNLEHLWFLWYLLIFVTIGPFVAKVVSLAFRGRVPHAVDGLGKGLIRFNVAAPVLGLITLPALLHARGFMGWSLTNPAGFLAPFPDFLVQYYPDEPFYFLYFLTGWWLYRMRSGLSDLSRWWLWNFVLGITGFALSQHLSDTYAPQTSLADYNWIRLGAFALYGVGSAFTTCGFIGLFQKYLDRPTRVGRYFVDTALWIYLIHLPLIPYLMWWIQPSSGAWWSATFGGMVVVTAASLVLFELFIRPTPLVYIFGPPSPRKPKSN
jgi:surface polysaccharide O-acyltransferase-like enzyme